MPSPQVRFLQNVLEQAKLGNEASIVILREIASKAMHAAPVPNLIALVELLVSIGIEATNIEAGRN